ncbi:ribosome recycling factor-domain-containing protein [Tirmania nivea]|nr:ribosome recycling factor-domain-containing protein [Tirmania nivea]
MFARPASSPLRQLARAAAQIPTRSSTATAPMAVISSRRLLFPLPSQSQTSTFSTTRPFFKKGNSPGKKNKQFKDKDTSEDDTVSTPTTKEVFDFDTHYDSVNASLQKHLTKLKDDLSRLRSSATNDSSLPISTLESLPVVLENDTPPTPLRDLAHVTPKPASRRHLLITIHAPEHTKKVVRAVQKADLNMQPVVEDPVNSPNVLTLPLPPPTREGREKLAEQAGKLGEKVKGEVRMVRQEGMKKLKGLVKGGKGVGGVKVDEVKKEEARLEKVVKGVEEEVKKVVEGARKGILEN